MASATASISSHAIALRDLKGEISFFQSSNFLYIPIPLL